MTHFSELVVIQGQKSKRSRFSFHSLLVSSQGCAKVGRFERETESWKTTPMKCQPKRVVGTSKPELESSELEVVNSEVGVGFIYTPKPQYAKCPSDC
jgi:hypothetical protein